MRKIYPFLSRIAAYRLLPLLLLFILLSSCTSMITNAVIAPAVNNLQIQQDVELVCEGAASHLLMIDSLIASEPENKGLLLIGTQAYCGSLAALSSCNQPKSRLAALSMKAREYGKRLLDSIVPLSEIDGPERQRFFNHLDIKDLRFLFWGTYGWLSWVQYQDGSPAAMADLVIIEQLMAKVLEIDETIENGSPHLFFGALYGSRPEMLGGDFERSKKHFERALEISNRSFLPVQTTFAETFCRMTFNQDLHDALLKEVLDYPLKQDPENTLVNQIAKRKARALLDEGFFD